MPDLVISFLVQRNTFSIVIRFCFVSLKDVATIEKKICLPMKTRFCLRCTVFLSAIQRLLNINFKFRFKSNLNLNVNLNININFSYGPLLGVVRYSIYKLFGGVTLLQAFVHSSLCFTFGC